MSEPTLETPEQRSLRLRIEQTMHNEREIEKQRERRNAGCAEWATTYARGLRPVPKDPGPVRYETHHVYDPLESFGRQG